MRPGVVAALCGAALLVAQPAMAQDGRRIEGRVTDAASGLAVPYARVERAGGFAGAVVVADSVGRFVLVVTDTGRLEIAVRRLGYRPARLVLAASAARLTVRLEPLAASLDTRVVTASRREERLAETVVATELITPGDIARSGATDAAALLVTHLGAQPDGGAPAGLGITLQGFGAQRVLVLLDGQPIVGRLGGHLDLSRIPLAAIERIEVVKGPQSTLYGSDAIGGVVNLRTRRSVDPRVKASVGAVVGSLGRREVSVGVGGGIGAWQAHLDAGASGLELAPGIASDAGTRTRRLNAMPRIAWEGALPWRVEARALLVDESQRYRSGQLYQFSDNTQINASLSAERAGGRAQVTPELSWSRYEHLSRRATTPAPVSDSGARDVQQLVQLEVPFSAGIGRTIADGGIALRRESIVAERVPGGLRTLHSAEPYLQLTVPVGDVSVTSGARVSVHEQWGTFLAPRLAVLWRLGEAVGLRASFGRGYRAPDFKEQHLEFANTAAGYAVRGNPELVPEHSTSGALNATVTGLRATWRVGVHGAHYRSFIESVGPDSTGAYTYANTADGTIWGAESEGVVTLGPARVVAGYAWLRARDGRSDRPLLGRAEHAAHLGVSATLAGVTWGASGRWTGRTPIAYDPATNVTDIRAGFTTADVTFATELRWRMEMRGGVRNVFDNRPGAGWPGFEGRRVELAVRVPLAGSPDPYGASAWSIRSTASSR